MKEISKISKIVEQVLEEDQLTRNSDTELYFQVCMRINPIACNMPFSKVMRAGLRRELGLPNYESVRRSRQKLQAEREDLKATEIVTDGRYEAFKEVLDYV